MKYMRILIGGTVALFVIVALIASGYTMTFNGAAPGSTASGTPVAVGTSTPVPVVACGPTLNAVSGVNSTMYIDFAVTGGTAGTDGCYVTAAVPQNLAANCVAASPAPNASTQVGYFLPTGGAGWQHTIINYPAFGGGVFLSSEWDAVCSAGSMKVSVTTLP